MRFVCHCCPDDWFAHLARQSVIDKVRVLLQAWRFSFSFVSLLVWLAHALRDALLTSCEEQRWVAACPCGCFLFLFTLFASFLPRRLTRPPLAGVLLSRCAFGGVLVCIVIGFVDAVACSWLARVAAL